jgi:non-specific serine/threonine protein kinase
VDWSYDLLTEQEKMLLARFSVFAGGWTLEAAEQVCSGAGIEAWEALDLLTGLLDKSLVLVEEEKGDTRYRMLETIRQYGTDKLESFGAVVQVRDRHRDYFLAFAEEATPKLQGPDQARWLTRLETEHDNLRGALSWCIKESALADDEAIELGLRLSGSLYWFWNVRGYLSEGREHLGQALGQCAGLRTTAVARALNGAGLLAWFQGDYTVARSLHESGLEISRELGDKEGIARALSNLGNVAKNQSDFTLARSLHGESLALFQELGDKQGIANALNNLGTVAHDQGDYATARSWYEQSAVLYRDLENKHGIAFALNNQGNVAFYQGDYVAARSFLEESLVLGWELGDKRSTAYCLESLAELSLSESSERQAVVLWGVAHTLRESIGSPLPPNDQAEQDQQLKQARSVLGEEVFSVAFEEGRAMRWEQAVALALNESPPSF